MCAIDRRKEKCACMPEHDYDRGTSTNCIQVDGALRHIWKHFICGHLKSLSCGRHEESAIWLNFPGTVGLFRDGIDDSYNSCRL